MRDDRFDLVRAWESSAPIFVLDLLYLSAIQFLTAALVYRTLGSSETDKLVLAGCLAFATLACLRFGLAFRKSGAPR